MNRVGEIINEIEIIGYRNAKDMDVRFSDGHIKTNVRYSHFKDNNIKNPFTPNVFGVGYFGEGIYNHKSNRKMSQVWMNMLQRCYGLDFVLFRPIYKGCSVHPDWHNFQNFAKWYEENYVEGFCLDKDLTILENKVYGPETCRFIPSEINVILTNTKKSNRKYPLGVTVHKSGRLEVSVSLYGTTKYLGLFDSTDEAFLVYKKEKENYLKIQAERYRVHIGEKIYENLMNYIINP